MFDVIFRLYNAIPPPQGTRRPLHMLGILGLGGRIERRRCNFSMTNVMFKAYFVRMHMKQTFNFWNWISILLSLVF